MTDRRSRGHERGYNEDNRRDDGPVRSSSRGPDDRDRGRDKERDRRDREDRYRRDDSRGRHDRPPLPRPAGASTSMRNTPPPKSRGDHRVDDKEAPGSGGKPPRKSAATGANNTFLAEVLKHSKQMYGDKANESTEPEEEEAGEILTGDKKRKHSPIVWDPESKVQRTSQPQGIYERALHEAAELKLMQQQEEESDDGPLMKGSPVLSESEDEDPDGVEARMKAALASKQQDQEQDGGEEGLPRAGGRWADLDEDDGEHRQGRGRGQGSVSPGAGIEGQGAPGSGPGGPSSDLSLGADSRGGDDGGVSPRTLLNNKYDMRRECRSVDEFERVDRISEGAYGVVYRAREKATGRIVALKRVKMEKERDGFPVTSVREINILLNFHHPNIVNVEEVVISHRNPDQIFMVMEFMDHDLKSLMDDKSMNSRPFSMAEAKCLMQQLLAGVAFLHHHWVLHRDLKTSNILYNRKGELKICDFGMARQYGEPLGEYTHLVVTLWYRAPELLFGQRKYSTAIDMWSCGAIMAEILTGKPLCAGQGELDQIDKIVGVLGTPTEADWPNLKSLPNWGKVVLKQVPSMLRSRFMSASIGSGTTLTEAGFDLLSRMLCWDPDARISAEDALKHRWFSEPPLPMRKELMPSFQDRKAQR